MLAVQPQTLSFKRKTLSTEDTNTVSSVSSTNSLLNVYDELDYFHCGSRKARCVSGLSDEIIIGYEFIAPSRSELQYNRHEGNQTLVLRKLYSPATALRSPVELSLQHPDDCSLDMISKFTSGKSSVAQLPCMYMPIAEKPPPPCQNASFSASLLAALGVTAPISAHVPAPRYPPPPPPFAHQNDADADPLALGFISVVPQLWSDFDDDSLDSPATKLAIASLRQTRGAPLNQQRAAAAAADVDMAVAAAWADSSSHPHQLEPAFTSLHSKRRCQDGFAQVSTKSTDRDMALESCVVTPGLELELGLDLDLGTPESSGDEDGDRGGGGGVLRVAESLWNSICEFVNEDGTE